MSLEDRIFSINNEIDFENISLEVFEYQFNHNLVYQDFCTYLKKTPKNVRSLFEIPFLPIESV